MKESDYMAKKRKRIKRLKQKLNKIIAVMKSDYRTYISGVIILFILCSALFAPLIAPHDPYKTNVSRRLEGPSKDFIAGTDSLGRDLFSRIIYASRVAVFVSFGGVIISVVLGLILGMFAAYIRGMFDNIILLIFDIIRAFPAIILILVLVSVLGPSTPKVILILGITIMPRYGRVVRAETLSTKEESFIESARSLGARTPRILFWHILPNIIPSVLVLGGMDMASMIMWEAGLSFLGFGVQPPATSWGLLLREGYTYIQIVPTMIIWPTLAISLTMFGFSIFAEILRIAINPKSTLEVESSE